MNEVRLTKMIKNQLKKIAKSLMKGDKKALEQFYNIYGKTIYLTAKMVCHTHENADEVVNDVLIKVWNMAEYFYGLDNPEGWIHTVTVNAAKDKLKQKQYQPLNEDIVDSSNDYTDIDNSDQFYSLIKDLNETEQSIMIYKFIEQSTFEEIAVAIDKPISSVSSSYYRALDKIKNKNINEFA